MAAVTDLIAGKMDIPIDQSRAYSIGLFAFKTAVNLEHLNRTRSARFFPREARYRFKQTLTIPPNVTMWMGYLPHPPRRAGASRYEISGHKTRSVFDCYNVVSESDLAEAARKLEAGAKTELGREIPTSFPLAPNGGSEEVAPKDRKPS